MLQLVEERERKKVLNYGIFRAKDSLSPIGVQTGDVRDTLILFQFRPKNRLKLKGASVENAIDQFKNIKKYAPSPGYTYAPGKGLRSSCCILSQSKQAYLAGSVACFFFSLCLSSPFFLLLLLFRVKLSENAVVQAQRGKREREKRGRKRKRSREKRRGKETLKKLED